MQYKIHEGLDSYLCWINMATQSLVRTGQNTSPVMICLTDPSENVSTLSPSPQFHGKAVQCNVPWQNLNKIDNYFTVR